jgi:hypothetical protein
MTLPDWVYAVMVGLLTRGNTFGQIVDRAGAGLLPAQVELLANDRVTVEADGPVSYRVDGQEVDPASIWHVRAYCPPAPCSGSAWSSTHGRRSAWGWPPSATRPAGSATTPPRPGCCPPTRTSSRTAPTS